MCKLPFKFFSLLCRTFFLLVPGVFRLALFNTHVLKPWQCPVIFLVIFVIFSESLLKLLCKLSAAFFRNSIVLRPTVPCRAPCSFIRTLELRGSEGRLLP